MGILAKTLCGVHMTYSLSSQASSSSPVLIRRIASTINRRPTKQDHHRPRPFPIVAQQQPQSPSPKTGWLVPQSSPHAVATNYDAILVLGGGLFPDGTLPPWVLRRLDGAHYVHSLQSRPDTTPICLLGAGTPHKPAVLDSNGYVLHESSAYAQYLIARKGMPSSLLLKETSSYDTVGNGYFSLTMHAIPAGWRRIAVVTSDFHMPRTRAIFSTCYKIAEDDLLQFPGAFNLDYHPVSDEGLFEDDVIQARAAKEATAVGQWRKNATKFSTLSDLHAWLFATHLCYSVSRQHEFGVQDDLDPRLKATY